MGHSWDTCAQHQTKPDNKEQQTRASQGSGGFSARAVWTVGGTVTHFGHRHFRQNRYDAQVSLVPDQDVWKIQSIEVFNEVRVR